MDLALFYEKEHKNELGRDFTVWLHGYFSVSGPVKIDGMALRTIKHKLNDIFQHEIDKWYSTKQDVQNQLNYIHGPSYDDDGAIMRC
jgi:hypothetical protein